jgi:hypothetical protein
VCPVGALCRARGVPWLGMETKIGHWRSARASINIYRCRLPGHCLGGLQSECAEHRTGVLCARCAPHYREANRGGGDESCEQCPTTARSVWLTTLLSKSLFIICCFVFAIDNVSARRRLGQCGSPPC